MKYFLTILTGILLASTSFGQTLTPVYYPAYMQGNGSGGNKVPYVCRFTVSDLLPNTTYSYVNHFVTSRFAGYGSGFSIFIRPNGDFVRVEFPDFYDPGICGEFTTDVSGSYTGWFINEVDGSAVFSPGQRVYFRLSLNDGNGGTWYESSITSNESINVIDFSSGADGGTAIRSTSATNASAKNFVFLYANVNPVPGEAPVTGTFIESEGTDNTTANFFATFYSDHVNAVDKTWGSIIPNNLPNGIKRISQYSLASGTEIGYKTSSDGNWAKEGGGTISTVNTTGGLTDVIVLDGNIITLGIPVAQSQTISFTTLPAKTYGDADFNPAATASSNLAVSYTSSNPAVATIVNNMIHIVGAGTADIAAEQTGNTDYLAATSVTQRLIINKAPLTVTVQDKTILQGDPIPTFAVSYSGFVNGDDETDLTTAATATTTITQSTTPGTYPITPGGAVSSNYDFNYINGVLTITAVQQPQTISLNELPAKTYGNADFGAGATVSSNLPLTYISSDPTVATIDNNGLIHIAGAGTTTIIVSQNGNSAFLPAAPISRTLTVDPAALTITAENKTRLVGHTNPVLTVQYSGFVNGENNTVFAAQPIVTTTATITSPVGDYPITVTGAVALNYAISYVNGVLAVQPLPSQNITFNPLPVKRYGDADFSAGASASSGLVVSYTSSNTQVATVDNNGIIHILSSGSTAITASQPGDPFNEAAIPATHILTVQKANLIITAVDTSKNEGQPNPALILSYSGFVNGDDVTDLAVQPTVITVATTASLTGNYPITVSGASSLNYNIANVNGTLRILPPNGPEQDIVNAYLSTPGKLRVNYHSTIAERIVVQLFDSYGNRLLDVQLTANKGLNTWYFEVSNLAAGIYPVRIIGKEALVKTKVIIR